MREAQPLTCPLQSEQSAKASCWPVSVSFAPIAGQLAYNWDENSETPGQKRVSTLIAGLPSTLNQQENSASSFSQTDKR